ncbi:hypothetical protein TGDOM2_364920 [Toxoplasma gondii GAB2-2007-GAL-DOM2]|uniref:Uncharacterized protein n=2 Tax=Toxoplasma gondii TaxID=5811 RepID=S7V3W3_TOXGG|nr:hypothetical protein TGGT1_364920 [Toxoplasma gondii GT1]KFG43321.1 hypothetical protein TGDOM2_364920 [Toxoplasma gondii GAB2-2007-GAL-DOM2]
MSPVVLPEFLRCESKVKSAVGVQSVEDVPVGEERKELRIHSESKSQFPRTTEKRKITSCLVHRPQHARVATQRFSVEHETLRENGEANFSIFRGSSRSTQVLILPRPLETNGFFCEFPGELPLLTFVGRRPGADTGIAPARRAPSRNRGFS